MDRVEFRVNGMTCGGCVKSVQNALNDQPGVSEATAELFPHACFFALSYLEMTLCHLHPNPNPLTHEVPTVHQRRRQLTQWLSTGMSDFL